MRSNTWAIGLGRLPGKSPDPDRVTAFRTDELRRVGCRPPRGRRCSSRPESSPPPAPAASQRPAPNTPPQHPIGGAPLRPAPMGPARRRRRAPRARFRPDPSVRVPVRGAPAADDEQERGRRCARHLLAGYERAPGARQWTRSRHARKAIRAACRRTAATATGAAVRSPLGRFRGSSRSGAGGRFRMPARRARGSGRRYRGPHRSAGLRRGRQPGIALLAGTSRRA
jgi:hypothetical protein